MCHFNKRSLPSSSGLFQRAILQSGTAMCPWCVADNHREMAFKLGHLLNCTSTSDHNSTELLACLSQTHFPDLILASSRLVVSCLSKVNGDFQVTYLPFHLLIRHPCCYIIIIMYYFSISILSVIFVGVVRAASGGRGSCGRRLPAGPSCQPTGFWLLQPRRPHLWCHKRRGNILGSQ